MIPPLLTAARRAARRAASSSEAPPCHSLSSHLAARRPSDQRASNPSVRAPTVLNHYARRRHPSHQQAETRGSKSDTGDSVKIKQSAPATVVDTRDGWALPAPRCARLPCPRIPKTSCCAAVLSAAVRARYRSVPRPPGLIVPPPTSVLIFVVLVSSGRVNRAPTPATPLSRSVSETRRGQFAGRSRPRLHSPGLCFCIPTHQTPNHVTAEIGSTGHRRRRKLGSGPGQCRHVHRVFLDKVAAKATRMLCQGSAKVATAENAAPGALATGYAGL